MEHTHTALAEYVSVWHAVGEFLAIGATIMSEAVSVAARSKTTKVRESRARGVVFKCLPLIADVCLNGGFGGQENRR